MSAKLYVDDERDLPDDSWTLARTVAEANELLDSQAWDIVSLDFTLGWQDATEIIAHMTAKNIWPKTVRLHSGSFSGQHLLAVLIEDAFEKDSAGKPEIVYA